ncbi:MAG: hypothetical protein LBD68_04550 [Zoogloeaceae bacterium]|jgi:hypothetical protein|nr:hypothetical protein [Zoogloeaceae bacterium]
MGSKKVTIGYRYYMGIHMALARGPLDEIREITVGDKSAWRGSASGNQSIYINEPDLFGGEKKEGGIQGTLAVLMGAPDQPRHSGLANMLGGLVPAFRGVASCFFDGMVCAMSPYPKAWAYRVRRVINGWNGGAAWHPDKAAIWMADNAIKAMNPAHILYQLYTDPDFGRGLPPSRLDDASFRAAANALHQEGFGLCLAWARTDSIASFAQLVIDHIGAVVYVGRDSGILKLKLVRDDYAVDSLPAFSPDSGLLGIDEDESIAASEMTNEIIVKYRSPTDGEERQVRVKNNAGVKSAGAVISETRDYSGIPTASLALRVAARDLKTATAGVKRLTLRLDRRGASLSPGDVFVVTDPNRNIGKMVMRAGRCEYGEGTDGTVTIEAAQDVFGLPATSYVGVEPPGYVPPDMTPYPCETARLVESPYRFVAQADALAANLDVHSGFLTAVAAAPSPLSYGFEVWTKTGANAYAKGSDDNGTFCAVGNLKDGIDPKATTWTLIAPDDATGLLDEFETGGAALIEDEWLRVDALAIDRSDAENPVITLTVGRGCCDSVAAPHPAGALVWFVEDGGGADLREYVSGANVSAKLVTVTPGGKLDLSKAPQDALAIVGRAGKPYPPGNLKINGASYPETMTGDLTVSWAHRDRVTQADLLVDANQGDIGPEPGVTYILNLYGANEILARTVNLPGTSYTWDTEISDAGGAGDTALLHFDGGVTDETGATWKPGEAGAATFADEGKFGRCLDERVVDYAYLQRSANKLGGNDFTVEAWVNVPNYTDAQQTAAIWSRTAGNSWSGEALLLCAARQASENFRLKVSLYSHSADRVNFLAPDIDLRGTGWRHVALTRASDVWTLWLDGQAAASRTFAYRFTASGYYDYIGASPLGETRRRYAQIDEFRMTLGIARYTTDFTPPDAPFAVTPITLNKKVRLTLESIRDGIKSLQKHDCTVVRP